jgi:hypothetical protein
VNDAQTAQCASENQTKTKCHPGRGRRPAPAEGSVADPFPPSL